VPVLLLDTCAVIWLAQGDPISPASRRAVDAAAADGNLLVSPVSAWEIGALAAKGRVEFEPSPERWFAAFLAWPGVRLAPLTPEAAIAAWFLPGRPHGDPADRMLIATARQSKAALVTRDRRIRAYGAAGHLAVIAC